MTKIRLTGRTVWVAVSRYADDDGLQPLLAVGDTKEAAEEALEVAIQSHNEDATFDRDMWIDEAAVELPICALA